MPLNWDKPIQFENGEPAKLIETWLNGTPNFPEYTRIVHRLNEPYHSQGSLWWFKEDGKSQTPGYNLVNIDAA